MRKKKNNVRTRARGNRTMYAPSTPAMAPLAPICGAPDDGETSVCAYVAMSPHSR